MFILTITLCVEANDHNNFKPLNAIVTANSPALFFNFSDRMAIVADGNRNDSDDIVGTPVSLAMLRIFDKSK